MGGVEVALRGGLKREIDRGGSRQQHYTYARLGAGLDSLGKILTTHGVQAFPPEGDSVEDLVVEAEGLRKCAALVSSLGQRVCSFVIIFLQRLDWLIGIQAELKRVFVAAPRACM